MTSTAERISEYAPDLGLIDSIEDAYSGEATDTYLWIGEFSDAAGRVRGLIEGGHGFSTWTGADPARRVRTDCRFCGDQLPLPDTDWLCEFDGTDDDCRCNWCEHRRMWSAHEASSRGRPRVQCGKPECVRAHNTERQRNSRRRRAEPPQGGTVSQATEVGRDDGPGTRHAVFPTLRKPGGGYADPTGDTAMSVAGGWPRPAVWELAYSLEWHREHR